jgi:hypothetical protein
MNPEDAAAHATKVFIDVGQLEVSSERTFILVLRRLLCRRNQESADFIQLPLNIRRYRARLRRLVLRQRRQVLLS